MGQQVRLFALSDTHGRLPTTDPPRSAAAVLHAGDWAEGRHRGTAAGAADADGAAAWVAGCGRPVYTVRGNHDAESLPPGVEDVTGRVVRVAERLFVAGVGWAGRHFADTPGESDVEPACRSIERMALRLVMPGDALVLLTHYPADLRGVFPDVGRRDGVVFDCVRRLVEQFRPVAVVQGHVHDWFDLSARVDLPGGGTTLVLNPGPHGAVLTVDTATRLAAHTVV